MGRDKVLTGSNNFEWEQIRFDNFGREEIRFNREK